MSTNITKNNHDNAFAEVLQMISLSREQAYQTINTLLIDLYWRIGEYISTKIKKAEWGDGVVPQLASYISKTHPGLRGFTRPNLFRMRQFFETYCDDKIVSPLVRQLPWTHNLIILSQSKNAQEREFYLRQAINERWSKRELERQVKSALFERVVLSPTKATTKLIQSYPEAIGLFKDAYMVEFLGLPDGHSEADLHEGLLNKLKDFLIELGRDFCFVGSQYPIQVGSRDFFLDLLFFHRGLNCLVVFELKVTWSSKSTHSVKQLFSYPTTSPQNDSDLHNLNKNANDSCYKKRSCNLKRPAALQTGLNNVATVHVLV